jgi:hypothetical protein
MPSGLSTLGQEVFRALQQYGVTCLGGAEVVRWMASRKPPEALMTRTKSKPKAITRARSKTKRKSSKRPVPVGAASGAPPRTRAGTKNAQVVAMLRDRAGTTIAAIMAATGWQQHSVRGFLAAVIRKKLGLNLVLQYSYIYLRAWIRRGCSGRDRRGVRRYCSGFEAINNATKHRDHPLGLHVFALRHCGAACLKPLQ